MANNTDDDGLTLLENAYSLSDPASNTNYYNRLADTYDADFAQGLGYISPDSIAQTFKEKSTNNDFPVLDIGCGTGLVAEVLSLPPNQIDGVDISERMLELALRKGLYRKLYEVDLTQSLDCISNNYGAVVSAGTFTHGHLGPEVLANLLDVASVGALFVIGVNREHYSSLKFNQLLEDLVSDRRIREFGFSDIPIYSRTGHSHSDDKARVLSYRKNG